LVSICFNVPINKNICKPSGDNPEIHTFTALKPNDEPGKYTTTQGGRTPQQKMDLEEVPLQKHSRRLLPAKSNMA
jgi:hypothetical protein